MPSRFLSLVEVTDPETGEMFDQTIEVTSRCAAGGRDRLSGAASMTAAVRSA